MENRYHFYAIIIDLIFNKIASLYYKNGPKLCPYSYHIIKFYFPYISSGLEDSSTIPYPEYNDVQILQTILEREILDLVFSKQNVNLILLVI